MKIWQKHEYIQFALAMLIVGMAASTGAPLLTLFLVEKVHVASPIAGLFFLTSLASPLVSLATGRLSDRLHYRQSLIIASALWLALGWLLMALVQQLWMAISIGLAFFCVSGTLSAQVFALLRDVMDRNHEDNINVISSSIRAFFSLGWILGPIIGSLLTALTDIRFAFVLTACLNLPAMLPLLLLRSRGTQHTSQIKSVALPLSPGSRVHILCFGLVCILVLSGDTIKLAYLPLYIVQGLQQNLVIFGTILSVSAIAELLLMPFFGAIADRIGISALLIVGILFGIVEYLWLAESTAIWQIYITQALHAVIISSFYGLGVTYAQRILRGQTGMASSIFFGAQSLASPVGSLLGSASLTFLGLPHIFFIPLISCTMALLLLFVGMGLEKTHGTGG